MICMCMSALYVLFTRICVRDVKLIDSVIDKHRQHSHFFFFFFFAKCVINSRVEYMQSFIGEIKWKTSIVCASMKIQHCSKTRKKSWKISWESKEEERGCSQRNQWTSGPVQYPWTTKLQNVAADRDEMMEGRKQGPSRTENTILSCYDEYLTLKWC